jgi:hypothetical protein
VAGALGLIVACGGTTTRRVNVAPAVSSSCPDLALPDELSAFDFANEYQLSRDAADKLKAAALASAEMMRLSDKLDAELGIACAQIAQDLGDQGDWRSGNDACAAAIKAVKEAREKLGPKASVELVTASPACLVDASLMTKCASICDSSVPAERVKADCERQAGRCDGTCDGTCQPKGAVKCEGACSGECEGPVSGTCGGRCKGKCEGRPVNGHCIGTCTGTCEGGAFAGQCGGLCAGICKPEAPGICEGLCVGTCTVDMTEPKCAGAFTTPDVSIDCRARCDLAVMNQTECAVPRVGLIVTGARARDTSAALESAVEKAFPNLMKILFEVGDEGAKRVLNAQAVIDGARTGFREMAGSGAKTTAKASEAQLVKCFDEPFKNAAAAAAAVKSGLDQAHGVRAEVIR